MTSDRADFMRILEYTRTYRIGTDTSLRYAASEKDERMSCFSQKALIDLVRHGSTSLT